MNTLGNCMNICSYYNRQCICNYKIQYKINSVVVSTFQFITKSLFQQEYSQIIENLREHGGKKRNLNISGAHGKLSGAQQKVTCEHKKLFLCV